jgi:hypothetical protein
LSPELVKLDLWWTKWRWGRFSQSTSVSPANFHSTKFSIITITRDRCNRPFSGRRAEWAQHGHSTPPPPLCEYFKLNYALFLLGPTSQWAPGVKRPRREADHLQLVPRSRIRGSIHPRPHTSSWCNAQLVTDGNIFTFFKFVIYISNPRTSSWRNAQLVIHRNAPFFTFSKPRTN